MNKFLLFVVLVGIVACNDATEEESDIDNLKNKIDTLAKKVEKSEVMVDSIRLKGGRLLDSTKSKGGRLVKGIEEKFSDLKIKKDSTK